jgi:nitrite reductase/ring-hydroxylating ferredoxin subunit
MRYLYSLVIILVLLSGCGKEQNYVPEVVVNYNVTLTQFSLQAKNGILLVPNQGVAGLIIVRTSLGSFVAFDRCSSVNPEKKCAIVPDESGLTATDPCSGAKFSLLDGTPQKAPAEKNLKIYNISLQGNVLLNVSN